MSILFAGQVLAKDSKSTNKASLLSNLERMANGLNLNDDQKNQLKTIVAKTQPLVSKNLVLMGKSRIELVRMTFSDSYDEKKANNLADLQGSLFAKLVKLNTNMKHQVYLILTPEQRQKMKMQMQKKKTLK